MRHGLPAIVVIIFASSANALQAHTALPILRRHAPPPRARPAQAFDVPTALYELQLSADALVTSQLQQLTPVSAIVLYVSGLVTSLTPCCLSMLPLTVAYFATEGEASPGGGVAASTTTTPPSSSSALPAMAYTLGLASALAALGVVAGSVGGVFGNSGGDALRALASLLAVVLGLNLLQLVPLQLGLGELVLDPRSLDVPRPAKAFLFGASSALVASPCASPVLASILGFVATLGSPLLGAGLLLMYTLGYTTPVLVASLATSSARDAAMQLEGRFEWVAPVGGALLLGTGTYNVLVAVLGPV